MNVEVGQNNVLRAEACFNTSENDRRKFAQAFQSVQRQLCEVLRMNCRKERLEKEKEDQVEGNCEANLKM